MNLISTIAAPATAPQTPASVPTQASPHRLDYRDQRILDSVRLDGRVKIWPLLARLADQDGPRSRDEARSVRLVLWARLKRLIRQGRLFYAGRNEVSMTKPVEGIRAEFRTRRSSRRASAALSRQAGQELRQGANYGVLPRQEQEHARDAGLSRQAGNAALLSRPKQERVTDKSACDAHGLHGGSGSCLPETGPDVIPRQIIDNASTSGFVGESESSVGDEDSQCAATTEEVSASARALARLPRRPKRRWSGWLTGSVRAYRNMRVLLPNGEEVHVFGARRGWVVFTKEPDGPAGDPAGIGITWGVVQATSVRIPKNEFAVRLGQLKAGKVERKSAVKALAARINGIRPCRPGKRRGRLRGKV